MSERALSGERGEEQADEGTQRHVARNTMLVGASFALAAVAGLGRNMLIARRFGIGTTLDTYYAAFRLPDLLFAVIAGGAMATSFIPVLANFLAEDDLEGAWRLGSAIMNLVILVLSALALAGIVFAPWLVRTLIAPGFDAAGQANTVQLLRLLLVSTIIFGISSVQTAMLHGFKHFLLPALSPVVYPLGVAAAAYWLAPVWGIQGLAVGAIVGATLHLLIKVPALIHYGYRWRPLLTVRWRPVRRVLLLMAPRVVDLGVFHLTMLATANLASRLDPGSVSALEWGWDAVQLPETTIGTAFGLVVFPTLAELAARGDLRELRGTFAESLRAVMGLAIPAAVGLTLVGRPLLRLLYQRGSFDAASTEAVYVALRFYATGLLAHASLELAARAFFAQEDTVTPLILAASSGLLNVALGLWLMDVMGHGGLALANSLAVTLEVLALLVILRRRWRGIQGWRMLRALGRIGLATLAMAVATRAVLTYGAGAGWGNLYLVAAGAAAGGLVYLVVGLLLGIEVLRWPLDYLLGGRGRSDETDEMGRAVGRAAVDRAE